MTAALIFIAGYVFHYFVDLDTCFSRERKHVCLFIWRNPRGRMLFMVGWVRSDNPQYKQGFVCMRGAS